MEEVDRASCDRIEQAATANASQFTFGTHVFILQGISIVLFC